MPRTAAPLLAAAALTLVLSGCAGEPEHTPETAAAIEAWHAQAEAALPEDASSLFALASHDDEPNGPQVRMDLPGPEAFDRIEVSCFGDGTMRIGVQLQSGSSVTGTGLDELRCADGPQVVEDVPAVRALDAVSATGSASSAQSAWMLVLYPADES